MFYYYYLVKVVNEFDEKWEMKCVLLQIISQYLLNDDRYRLPARSLADWLNGRAAIESRRMSVRLTLSENALGHGVSPSLLLLFSWIAFNLCLHKARALSLIRYIRTSSYRRQVLVQCVPWFKWLYFMANTNVHLFGGRNANIDILQKLRKYQIRMRNVS